jgi:hypothetical protein
MLTLALTLPPQGPQLWTPHNNKDLSILELKAQHGWALPCPQLGWGGMGQVAGRGCLRQGSPNNNTQKFKQTFCRRSRCTVHTHCHIRPIDWWTLAHSATHTCKAVEKTWKLKAEYFNDPQSNRYSLVLLSVPHAGPLTRTHNLNHKTKKWYTKKQTP